MMFVALYAKLYVFTACKSLTPAGDQSEASDLSRSFQMIT